MTTAYMQSHHKVLLTQYEAMRDLCIDLAESTFKLFCHILVCSLLKLREEGKEQYSPISSKLIDKEAPGAKWKDLSDRWLIEHTPYYIEAGLSREYRVTEAVLDLFFKLGDIPDYRSAVKVNLFSGKISKTTCKNSKTDDTGNSEPLLIQTAMDIIAENKCIYEEEAIENHILELREACKEKIHKEDNKIVIAGVMGRYYNDKYCFDSVLDQNPKHIGNGFYEFKPAYKPTSTGRIHIKKGGLQSCSREMKRAAYSNIPGLRNYDLKGSQVNIAIQLLEDAGIDNEWLCTYRDTTNNKYLYAELAGLSVDGWKTCLLAMLMGAYLPKNKDIKRFETSESAILAVLGKETNGNIDEIFRINGQLTKVVSGLDKSLNQWHDWLIESYIPANQKQGGQERRWYIQNKAEKRLCVSDLPKAKKLQWKAKAQVAAFLLQGQEALFIHKLTVISKQYNYKPIANEHDGLVTIGDIPLEAVNIAAEYSGLKYAVLEDKPFML